MTASVPAATNPHYWSLPLPLGCMASDPEGRHGGRIVAVFANYKAAQKWGAWDLTYTSADERPEEPYYLIHTNAGALLVGSRHTLTAGGSGPPRSIHPAVVHVLTHKLINPPSPVPVPFPADDAALEHERKQARERQRRRRERLRSRRVAGDAVQG